MPQLLLPNSFGFAHREFEIEIIPDSCRGHSSAIETIKEQVLHVATLARGWDDQESLERMRAHFKLGPLYEANALALIRRNNTIVGLSGTVNDWQVNGNVLVHLCSLGLLAEAQGRGFLPVLMAMLWPITLQRDCLYDSFRQGLMFVTAITQSPYLYAMLHGFCNLHPSPGSSIPENVRQIARAVVQRFDNHLDLDEDHLILRKECQFFYRRTPYSSNRALNAFCDHHLRYDQGDVFVLVGQVIPKKVKQYVDAAALRHPELFDKFWAALEQKGYRQVA